MSIVYDYPTVTSEHDYAVEKIERYNNRVSGDTVIVGSYLVDIFPWMYHVPERSWFSLRCLVGDIDRKHRFAK